MNYCTLLLSHFAANSHTGPEESSWICRSISLDFDSRLSAETCGYVLCMLTVTQIS